MSVRTGIQTDVIRILGTPVSHFDVIQEGPFATVARAWTAITDGVAEWVVVKSATTQRKFAREPHDIVKELRLLSTMVHPNIVTVLGSFRDDDQSLLSIYMPYLPISLSSLLASPRFSPHPFPPPHSPSSPISRHHPSNSPSKVSPEIQTIKFTLMTRSIIAQTLAALAFLHDPVRSVGHRDIKPENILLTTDGCVKIIDFGVAWKANEKDVLKSQDLWPEYKGKLYFEVSTRAYRAPELLFGSRHYDHLAIDLWSLGVTFTEFFTPLRLHGDEEDADDDDDDDSPEDDQVSPFMIPRYLRIGYPGAQWRRDSLFDGQRGEIGLAWSIFKVLGTPNESNWPDFKTLPGASSVVFKVVPCVPLRPMLANLPPSNLINPATLDLTYLSADTMTPSDDVDNKQRRSASPSAVTSSTTVEDVETKSTSSASTTNTTGSHISVREGQEKVPSVLDLLHRFLVYPSATRLRAEDALRHPWFVERLDGKPSSVVSPSPSEVSSLSSMAAPVGCGNTSIIDREETTTPRSEEHMITPFRTAEGESISDQSLVNACITQEVKDPALPLLLLPPGYALDRGTPALNATTAHVWCGYTLANLLEDVLSDGKHGVQ